MPDYGRAELRADSSHLDLDDGTLSLYVRDPSGNTFELISSGGAA
jgi:hypothetical protein